MSGNSININSNNGLLKKIVTIPSATVQIMSNTNAVQLVDTNSQFFAIPLHCYFVIGNNQTVTYANFNDIHLQRSNNVNDKIATYSENAITNGELVTDICYSFNINLKNNPVRYGSAQGLKGIFIAFGSLPTKGNGDMIVHLWYTVLVP